MCTCNGTGGIKIERNWGIEFKVCPDTNCTFDREENHRKYEKWKQKVIKKIGNIFESEVS